MVEIVSFKRPHRATERQMERWEASLGHTKTTRAWPEVEAASLIIHLLLRLYAWPADLSSSLESGSDWELGTRLGVSFDGAKAADWAAEKMTSRMSLWREMRSQLPPQPTGWSTNWSVVPCHSGQECGLLWRGTPRQYRR